MNFLAKATEALKSGNMDELDSISDEITKGNSYEDVLQEDVLNETVSVDESPDGEQADEEINVDVTSTDDEQALESTSDEGNLPVSSVSNIEEVAFTDHKGRRTTKIDFSDRDKMKKLAAYALGAPKWKVERDQYKEQLTTLATERETEKSTYGKLDEAWGEGGADGISRVVALLAGDDGALDSLLDARSAERARVASMDPLARQKFEWDQQRIQDRMEFEKKLTQLTTKEQEAVRLSEEVHYKEQVTKAQIAYDKFNFIGKLGNDVEETEFGEYVWEKAISELEKRGISSPTQGQMNKAFEIHYKRLSNRMEGSIATQVEKKIGQAKNTADKTAASIARKNIVNSKDSFVDKFRKNSSSLMMDILTGKS